MSFGSSGSISSVSRGEAECSAGFPPRSWVVEGGENGGGRESRCSDTACHKPSADEECRSEDSDRQLFGSGERRKDDRRSLKISSSPLHVASTFQLIMAPLSLLMLLMVVGTVTRTQAAREENELDYWNYREGAESVYVASVRSVTRVLDAWGKRIFSEIKTLLHSEPNSLLPDYSRVRPLSESVSDLFREVSLLRRRITELTHRLATLQPYLRRHGYRGEDGDETGGSRALRGEVTSLTRYPLKNKGRPSRLRGTRVVGRRRVRILKNRRSGSE
nr:uncharacterized protein si:ch211-243a20.3 [Nothobranchius furzeri]